MCTQKKRRALKNREEKTVPGWTKKKNGKINRLFCFIFSPLKCCLEVHHWRAIEKQRTTSVLSCAIIAAKLIQLQNPLLRFHKTTKGNFSGEDFQISPTVSFLDDSDSLGLIMPYCPFGYKYWCLILPPCVTSSTKISKNRVSSGLWKVENASRGYSPKCGKRRKVEEDWEID